MQVAGIIRNSVVNGIGIRDVVFLQGCKHHCKGCHNPETWKLYDGVPYLPKELAEQFKDSKNGLTISGGEPLLQYNEVMQFISDLILMRLEPFSVWLYTGFRYEEIPPHLLDELSRYVDVLVDGRFEEDKKDLTLQFRGSSNQRLIDLPKSRKLGKIVLWEDNNG